MTSPDERARKAAYMRVWRADNAEHIENERKRWRAENPERARAGDTVRRNRWRSKPENAAIERELNRLKRQEERARDPEGVRARARAYDRKYAGVPEPTRPQTLVCEMCGEPPKGRRLNLDHCHVTGEFRGWLCVGCNTALGKLGDNFAEAHRRLNTYEAAVKAGRLEKL